MGNSSIEIEIIANFKDNATDKAKNLNSELDKLDKRKVNIDMNATTATKAADELDCKLSKIDGSAATKSIYAVKTSAETTAKGISPIKMTANTADVDNALKRVKTGIEDVSKASAKVSAKNWGYSRSAMDAINSYGDLKQEKYDDAMFKLFNENYVDKTNEPLRIAKVSAKSMGYDQSAIDFINAYVGEDITGGEGAGSLWSRISPEIDKNLTVKRFALMGRMYGSTAESVKGQALAGFGATTGLAVAGTALASAGSDFMNAYSSNNHNDTERSIYRGFTKGLLTVAGGAIGSFIAPGVGTMIGAGIGGGVSDLFGDKLADSISGIHKSAEELKQDRLDEIFGDIAMSAENLSKVAKNMLGDWTTQVAQAHSQALATGYSLQDTTNSSYFGVTESGSKLDIKGNLGFYIPNSDFSSYKTQVSNYMDGIEETMTQEMYNAFMVNDDLFGYGNWDTTALSDKWKNAFEAFYKQKKELSKYLELALSDGNFSLDEREHVNTIIQGTQQTITDLTPNEGDVKLGSFNWLSGNGMLSQDSYDGLQKEIWSGLDSTIQTAAEKRTRAGGGAEADTAAWNTILTEADRVSNASLEGIYSQYGTSINNARDAYWENTQNFLNGNGISEGFEKTALHDPSQLGSYIQIKDFLGGGFAGTELGFNKIDDVDKQLLSDEYTNNILPHLNVLESVAQGAKQKGLNTSEINKNLLENYAIGAMGGDFDAQQKYIAGLLAGNPQYAKMIAGAMSTSEGRMNFSSAFREAWDIFNIASDPYDILMKDQSDTSFEVPLRIKGEPVQDMDFGMAAKGFVDKLKSSPEKTDVEVPVNVKGEITENMSFGTVLKGFIDKLKNPTGQTEIPVQVTPKFQVKAGNLNSSFSELPDVKGTANYELGTSPEEVPDATGVANYTGNFSGIGQAPTRYGTVVYTPTIGGVGSDSNAAQFNLGTFHWAKGTDNAPAGDAWINDDGTSWPYELIEHNGKFRMYEGRNVLTKLEQGDRVYTSSQTKDILSGKSIPRFAQGLNNEVIPTIVSSGGSGGGVNVEVGGITVSIQIDSNSNGGNVVEQIKSHSAEIAEVITVELDRHLSASFANSGGGG